MKKIGSILFLLIFFSISLAYAGRITVTVKNIKTITGVIRVALYNKKEDFPKKGREYKTKDVPVKAKKVIYTFKDIPEGWYAIALYHDINNDNTCNKNFFGIPVEPFGFSNNIKVKFSAPKFDKCSFFVNGNVKLSIELYKK